MTQIVESDHLNFKFDALWLTQHLGDSIIFLKWWLMLFCTVIAQTYDG